MTMTERERKVFQFNKPAPVRRLTWGSDLISTSHPKDGVVNGENKLHELVSDCYDSCTKGAAGDRTSDLLIHRQAS